MAELPKGLQRELDRIVAEHNNAPLAEYENYSSEEMRDIIYYSFAPSAIVSFRQISSSEYERIPILNQIRFFAQMVKREGSIKLTSKGYLPPRFVKELYGAGYIKDSMVEKGFVKLNKEMDLEIIHMTRLLAEVSGVVKKRHNALSLTKRGAKLVDNNEVLFELLFFTFTQRINWAYFDGYDNEEVGQLGLGFTFILLDKYGKDLRPAKFYSEKYFKAFPTLMEKCNPPIYLSRFDWCSSAHILRTFERFMSHFGLVDIYYGGSMLTDDYRIRKTDLFKKLIFCEPPQMARSSGTVS